MIRPKVGLIMRSDEIIKKFKLKRITVETSYGPVDRCYIGTIYGVDVLILYGRFNGQKVPSNMINHQQNIEVMKNMGITKLVGTFVVGGIDAKRTEGTAYVLGDLVGMGNYKINVNQTYGFHNAEMYNPFCEKLVKKLKISAEKQDFNVVKNAIYVCFHGWPRIETKAELEFYNKMGWDIVGQTCDPEATLARINGICYAGIAVQIDNPMQRELQISPSFDMQIENTSTIKMYRKKTTSIILQFLKDYAEDICEKCNKLKRTNNSFKEFPEFYYE